MSSNKSLVNVVIEMVQDFITIGRHHFELLKQNISFSLKKFGKGLGFWITAFLLLNLSLLFVLIALAFGLSEFGLSNWLSFLIVALIMLVLALLFIIFGFSSFKKIKSLDEKLEHKLKEIN